MNPQPRYIAEELDGSRHCIIGDLPVELDGERSVAPRGDVADDVFRAAMRLLPSGVVLVTTWHDGRPWGLTISSCSSVSVDPARLLISIGRHTATYADIARDGSFGINVLARAHKSLALYGAAAGAAKFVDDHCASPDTDCAPRVRDAIVHLDCQAESRRHVGDHVVVVGRISGAEVSVPDGDAVEPLLFFDRRFWGLGPAL